VTVDGRPRWRRPTGRPTGSSAGRPLRQIGPGGRDPVRRDLVGPEVRAVATAHRLGKVAPLTTVVAPSRLVRCPDRIRLRLGQPLLQRLPPGRFRPPRTGNHRRIVRNGSPNSPIRIERTAPPKTGPSMTTCGVPAVRSFLRLDPTPAVRMTVRPFRRPGGVRAGRTCPDRAYGYSRAHGRLTRWCGSGPGSAAGWSARRTELVASDGGGSACLLEATVRNTG
jgi:hypothetical protein